MKRYLNFTGSFSLSTPTQTKWRCHHLLPPDYGQNFLHDNLIFLISEGVCNFLTKHFGVITYFLIALLHYSYLWTDEPKLKAELRSRVAHNSCIQRRRLCASKTERNEQAARNKKFVQDFSGVVSHVGNFLKIRKGWLASGVLKMRRELKYSGSCCSFWHRITLPLEIFLPK